MPTTAEYLSDLTTQRDNLAEALNEAGVAAENDETFNTLVPKVGCATVKVKEYADSSFSNALKRKVMGEAIRINDPSPFKHPLNVKISSYNLLPFPYEMSDSSGAEILSEGGILISAPATLNNVPLSNVTLQPGSYTLGLIVEANSGAPNILIRLNLKNSDGDMIYSISLAAADKRALSFTLTAPLTLSVDISASCEAATEEGGSVKVFPLIVSGERSADSFKYLSFTGELEGKGVRLYGKNLFGGFISDTTFALGSSITVNPDGSVHVIKKSGEAINVRKSFYLPPGIYTISNGLESGSLVYMQISFGSKTLTTLNLKSGSYNWSGGTVTLILYSSRTSVADVTLYPQLELSNIATSFEKYDPEIARADQNGNISDLSSRAGVMTLLPSTSGITVTAEYNRDINAAFAELEAAING